MRFVSLANCFLDGGNLVPNHSVKTEPTSPNAANLESLGEKSIDKSVDKSSERVRRMFAEIAPRYDLLNHTLSLNIDKYWRKRTLDLLAPKAGDPFLDVCTGTGDLALSAAMRLRPKREDQAKTEVVASDFCGEMLRFARSKQTKMGIDSDSLVFLEADTTQLPFVDNRFQTVSVAFGLRNVVDTMKGLREMARVCRPGGQVAVLEFSQPTFPGLKQFYQFYFRHVLPRIGNQVAKNSSEAYAYLPQSVSQFPSGEAMADMMREVPLVSVRYYPMTFGVATLYVGTKPAS
ncbi:MAG: Demethylmenaquinone methyltransferase [Planctomycetota bacterium]|jgi:demethylmenaquinone methyltransferase/2-methoxy-6-polyprenyl-1,4-benzoquinol methylase